MYKKQNIRCRDAQTGRYVACGLGDNHGDIFFHLKTICEKGSHAVSIMKQARYNISALYSILEETDKGRSIVAERFNDD